MSLQRRAEEAGARKPRSPVSLALVAGVVLSALAMLLGVAMMATALRYLGLPSWPPLADSVECIAKDEPLVHREMQQVLPANPPPIAPQGPVFSGGQ